MKWYHRALAHPWHRELWFPAVAGMAAHAIMFFLGGLALTPPVAPRYSDLFCSVVNFSFLLLGPGLLLGGVAAYVWGAVLCTRALLARDKAQRWQARIGALLSWSGVVFTLWVAVFLVINLILYW